MKDTSGPRASFLNTRCRLQRLRDAKLFNGWVTDLSPEDIRVKISASSQMQAGEAFCAELQGLDRAAIIGVFLTKQMEDELSLKFKGDVKYLPSREKARVRVQGVSGRFKFDGKELPFEVSDASADGCKVLVQQPIARGTSLNLWVDAPSGEINCVGTVCFCRRVPNTEVFAVGMAVDVSGRLEKVRWNQFFVGCIETEAA